MKKVSLSNIIILLTLQACGPNAAGKPNPVIRTPQPPAQIFSSCGDLSTTSQTQCETENIVTGKVCVWQNNACAEKNNCTPLRGLRVDPTVAQSGDGSSWKKAFKTIQEAITNLAAHDDISIIFLASGNYSLSNSILVSDNKKLIGGFNNIDRCVEDRDIPSKQAILDFTGLSKLALSLSEAASIGGFIMQNGTSGIMVLGKDVRIDNITIQGFSKDALYGKDMEGLHIIHSKFINNKSYLTGAIHLVNPKNLFISNSKFSGNSSNLIVTGIKISPDSILIDGTGSTGKIEKCVFDKNKNDSIKAEGTIQFIDNQFL